MVLKQIWTDTSYIYTATTSGLGVIDTLTETLVNFITYPAGINSVWADDTNVYLATSNSGIRYVSISNIDTALSTNTFINAPLITGSEVRYLHGSSERLMCCTNNGVDIIRLDFTGSTKKTVISGAYKCFVSDNYYYYYSVSSGIDYTLNRTNDISCYNWTPDYVLKTGDGVFSNISCLIDFYVTTSTAVDGVGNTLFIATNGGICVYDEVTEVYELYTTISATTNTNYIPPESPNTSFIFENAFTPPESTDINFTFYSDTSSGYDILMDSNVNFLTSVWAEPDASMDHSKFYVASSGTGARFSVVDLSNKVLYDSYSITEAGLLNDTLDYEDIVDINIVSL